MKEKKVRRRRDWKILKEFKEFLNRGNAFMLAVGVVIGGAFSAIVNAVVNILLSTATWALPGGLKGLITVLPAINDAQKGLDPANGLGQKFTVGELQGLAEAYAQRVYGSTDATVVSASKNEILAKYTQYGGLYAYKMSAIIDWGTLLTAVISFIIIGLVLFILVKTANSLHRKREELKARALEEYYKRHPEERPAPVEPGVPEPTEKDYLKQIVEILQKEKDA
ncbi:MAG: MscL family protein [Erysipelotrichaceae bacterium]|nr:MscL family protein [Erysipelotrichaceae bacterium]